MAPPGRKTWKDAPRAAVVFSVEEGVPNWLIMSFIRSHAIAKGAFLVFPVSEMETKPRDELSIPIFLGVVQPFGLAPPQSHYLAQSSRLSQSCRLDTFTLAVGGFHSR